MAAKPVTLLLKTVFYIFAAAALFSCGNSRQVYQSFDTGQDTLVLYTQKHKTPGLFGQSYVGNQFFKDTFVNANFTFPTGIDSLYRAQFFVDLNQRPAQAVEIISGYRNGIPVYVVDENNNKNLGDDPVYDWKTLKWHNPAQLAHCTFQISNGSKMVHSESWLNIGVANGWMQMGRSEHLTASFRLGKNNYTIGIADPYTPVNFTYGGRTQAALLSANGSLKDTLITTDILVKDNYFNLGGQYYRFADISNNGDRITLIKENAFSTKTGTQAGMLAPGFKAVNTQGQTVTTAQNRNRYIIIANSCSCGGDAESAQAGAEISRLYSPVALVLNMDTGKGVNLGQHTIDTENPSNKELYETYRGEYCSRLCYVIGPDGRVVDKFETPSWKNHLPKLIKL